MNERVLIVDDDLSALKLLMSQIQDAGYSVETASNGREGVGAFVQALHGNNLFSLVVLDIMMPDVNGLEVYEIIRKEEECRQIPKDSSVSVLVLTALDAPWMESSLIKSCDDYIFKPYNVQELLEKIEKLMKAKKPKNE